MVLEIFRAIIYMADLEQFYNKLFQFLYKNRKKGHDIIGLIKDSGRSVYKFNRSSLSCKKPEFSRIFNWIYFKIWSTFNLSNLV